MTVVARTVDNYPTRSAGATGFRSRRDKTVWGSSGGPLDQSAISAYDANGYVIERALFSPSEIAGLTDALTDLSRDQRMLDDDRTVIEQASMQVRSIFEAHKISADVDAVVRDPRILGAAQQILGSDVYVHQCRINYMPGFRGTGFYWHSDFETWHAEDGMPVPRAVSVSIALCDNYPFNGGLMLMPGSHRTFVPCRGETPRDNYRTSLREQRIGVPTEPEITELARRHGISQFTGKAGDTLLFDSNVMHGSGNNITPFPRSNLFIVFNSVHNALQEPFAAPAARPNYIASRDFTPVRRQ
ncbi:ectoine hydroxylase [Skermania sp. ID1734]|uniref:ectoine hydroxylase n=1 Tax=Skermania sp. ID1734 TaxID=2597516 RepID=UPI00117C4DE1|nr:ectoine hydroxylase [Skermania sp. ID1734]TSD97311.1 ectoine hydroxylase [Skermania sp. ID1734]